MELWEKVCYTNPRHVKRDEYSGNVTFSIDAYQQIQKATELFGSFGNRWGVRDERFTHAPNEDVCLYTATLYYPGGMLPIHADIEIIYVSGSRKGKYNSGWTKKVATNALTKGLSKIGFNADVFQGKFNNPEYVLEMDVKYGNRLHPNSFITKDMQQEIIDLINELDTIDEVSVLVGTNKAFKTEFKNFNEFRVMHYNWVIKTINRHYRKG